MENCLDFGVCYSGGQHSAACGRNAVGGDAARLRTPWYAATTEAPGVPKDAWLCRANSKLLGSMFLLSAIPAPTCGFFLLILRNIGLLWFAMAMPWSQSLNIIPIASNSSQSFQKIDMAVAQIHSSQKRTVGMRKAMNERPHIFFCFGGIP